MNLNQVFRRDGQAVYTPVFNGLEKLGFSGLDIAEITYVSPPTISKWRNGYAFTPNEFIVFLTLVLASRLLDVLEQSDDDNRPSQAQTGNQRSRLKSARGDLEAQERINYNLPPSAVRAGAIRFRYWWHTQQRLKITEIRMNAGQVNQFLAAY